MNTYSHSNNKCCTMCRSPDAMSDWVTQTVCYEHPIRDGLGETILLRFAALTRSCRDCGCCDFSTSIESTKDKLGADFDLERAADLQCDSVDAELKKNKARSPWISLLYGLIMLTEGQNRVSALKMRARHKIDKKVITMQGPPSFETDSLGRPTRKKKPGAFWNAKFVRFTRDLQFAQLKAWKDEGSEWRSPARVVYVRTLSFLRSLPTCPDKAPGRIFEAINGLF